MKQPQMPPEIREFDRHQKKTHRLARDVLRNIAKKTGRSLRETRDDFKAGDYDTTMAFWLEVENAHPGQFNRVEFCSECRAFHLWLSAEGEPVFEKV
jgi:hypothetical protein